MEGELLGEWLAALPEGVPGEAAAATARDLLTRWGEQHRRYHTLAHLRAMLGVLGELGAPPVVRLAAWYHDAVYDPRRSDNEERSALLAIEQLGALGVPADEVARLVRLTAGHDPAPEDGNGALLCDADLAILAVAPPDYAGYAAAVRDEYRHVPEPAFRAGRAAVLRRLLDLPVLYRTGEAHRRWEAAARANLAAELAGLSAPGSGASAGAGRPPAAG
jgi:predicted metal-dependent HD superfamily phosphohydrolase